MNANSDWPPFEQVKQTLITLHYQKKLEHLGSALSLLSFLYPLLKDHFNFEKDQLVLAKGHGITAYYAIAAHKRWISPNDLTLACDPEKETSFYAHTPHLPLPGLMGWPFGALGYGLTFGVLLAWKQHLAGLSGRTFVILSEGDLNVGLNWEALDLSSRLPLAPLFVFLDQNGYQATDRASNLQNWDALKKYLKALGWHQCVWDVTKVLKPFRLNPKKSPLFVWVKTDKTDQQSWSDPLEAHYAHNYPLPS